MTNAIKPEERLDSTLKEIETWISDNDIQIFWGDVIDENRSLIKVNWDSFRDDDWKSFLSQAVKQDCHMIIIETDSITPQEMYDVLEAGIIDRNKIKQSPLEELSKHHQKEELILGRIGLKWIKDSVVYSFLITTIWYEEFSLLDGILYGFDNEDDDFYDSLDKDYLDEVDLTDLNKN